MSEGSSTRATAAASIAAAPTGPIRSTGLTPPGLLASLVPLLREWVPRQRWFAGKGRPIHGFTLVSATELLPVAAGGATPGLLHLLVRAQQPGPPTNDCYQLLLGIRSTLPPVLAPALIGRPTGGPLHGRTVYDALQDPRLTALLLERLRMPGRLGALRFTREPGTAIASSLPSRPITAEQSNTSVVYGDAYILKVFRRTAPGVNPDLELPLALARTKCDRVPAPAAWFEAEGVGEPPAAGPADVSGAAEAAGAAGLTVSAASTGSAATATSAPSAGGPAVEPTTLGVLQPFLPDAVDGWQLALHSLSLRADFSTAARALGRATAEVHLSLAEALPTAVLRRPQIEHLATGMAERLAAAAAAVPALRPYCAGLRTAFDELGALGRDGRTWPAQRIHGDLHLGQTLRTAADGRWALIDFEGEPARPLAERRRAQPALRDVAAMLRSFDYAARSLPSPEASPGHQAAWAQDWSRINRDAFCAGYAEAGGADPLGEPELLRAFETDKAVYEVLYEARHRPDWLPVPMAAIRRLAGADGSGADAGTGSGAAGAPPAMDAGSHAVPDGAARGVTSVASTAPDTTPRSVSPARADTTRRDVPQAAPDTAPRGVPPTRPDTATPARPRTVPPARPDSATPAPPRTVPPARPGFTADSGPDA
ncbi:maltokinase N-terminal cap-like domain-containing protein [Streptomyces sp. H27-D2]|uniref:maltokinase N-terminal cap-like domain-containing protein n=1 Tax=Streptomyces sp. H27-D2 TaxID=3046304 RepID=UPI002DB6DF02|nr:maltokinase [Streptomyces sp. H27-D2]MEC4019717.1 maltokinase [Streptomyces sp. H27-D2]